MMIKAFHLMLTRLKYPVKVTKRERDDNMDVGVSSFSLEPHSHTSLSSLTAIIVDIAKSVEDQPVQPRHHRFPYTYILNKSQSFNPSLFDKYTWLEYSIAKDTAFCYACRVFSAGVHKSEECFITIGYRNWKHATGKSGRLEKHTVSQRHKHAKAAWSDFKHSQISNTSIASTLSNERREQVQQNRHYMKTIVEVLMFCAF